MHIIRMDMCDYCTLLQGPNGDPGVMGMEGTKGMMGGVGDKGRKGGPGLIGDAGKIVSYILLLYLIEKPCPIFV